MDFASFNVTNEYSALLEANRFRGWITLIGHGVDDNGGVSWLFRATIVNGNSVTLLSEAEQIVQVCGLDGYMSLHVESPF